MLESTIAVPDPAAWQTALRQIGRLLQSLGQVPMGWPAPDGFPEVADAWSGPGAGGDPEQIVPRAPRDRLSLFR